VAADCIKASSSTHQSEIAAALGLAAHRWNQLLALEQQVTREEQELAVRPRRRGTAPGDEFLASELVKKAEAAWEEETKARRDSLAEMKGASAGRTPGTRELHLEDEQMVTMGDSKRI
jgi:hypothetical protein